MKDMSFLTLCYASLRSPFNGLSSFFEVKNSAAMMLFMYLVGVILYSVIDSVMTVDFSILGATMDVARYSMFVFGITLFPTLWISFSLYFVGAKKGFFIYYSLMLWSVLIFIFYSVAVNAALYVLTIIFDMPAYFYLSVFVSQASIILILSICSSVIAYKISYFRSVSGHLMGLSVFIIVPFLVSDF